MDDMREWEVAMLLPIAIEAHRTEWETARYIVYHDALVSGNLKKQYTQKSMTELFPLPYDESVNHGHQSRERHDIEISDRQVDMMRRRASMIANKLSEQKSNGKHR